MPHLLWLGTLDFAISSGGSSHLIDIYDKQGVLSTYTDLVPHGSWTFEAVVPCPKKIFVRLRTHVWSFDRRAMLSEILVNDLIGQKVNNDNNSKITF